MDIQEIEAYITKHLWRTPQGKRGRGPSSKYETLNNPRTRYQTLQKKITDTARAWARTPYVSLLSRRCGTLLRESARHHKRRARRWQRARTLAQFIALGNACLCCRLDRGELAVFNRVLVPDHVIPIAHGGSNDISNIQPLCHGVNGCNNHKGVKHTDYRTS